MVKMALDYGWGECYGAGSQSGTNMKLAIQDGWSVDIKETPSIDHYPGDTHLGYNLSEITRIITLKGVIFKTTADVELAIANFKAFNGAAAWKFKMKIISGGTYFKFDGTNTTIEVFFKQIKGITKLAKGDGTVYKIGQIQLEEAA